MHLPEGRDFQLGGNERCELGWVCQRREHLRERRRLRLERHRHIRRNLLGLEWHLWRRRVQHRNRHWPSASRLCRRWLRVVLIWRPTPARSPGSASPAPTSAPPTEPRPAPSASRMLIAPPTTSPPSMPGASTATSTRGSPAIRVIARSASRAPTVSATPPAPPATGIPRTRRRRSSTSDSRLASRSRPDARTGRRRVSAEAARTPPALTMRIARTRSLRSSSELLSAWPAPVPRRRTELPARTASATRAAASRGSSLSTTAMRAFRSVAASRPINAAESGRSAKAQLAVTQEPAAATTTQSAEMRGSSAWCLAQRARFWWLVLRPVLR